MTEAQSSRPASTTTSIARVSVWRCSLQYRLRTLLIVTTIVATLLAWWSYNARKAQQQRSAVARLSKSGVVVLYDYQRRGLYEPPHWPSWLVRQLGVDYFANVHLVHFDREATDADVEPIQYLTGLKEVNLGESSHVTDASCQYISRLSELRQLRTANREITDDGVQCFRNLTTLECLEVHNSQPTKIDFTEMSALREIDLNGTQLDDAGLASLQRHSRLERVWLAGTPVTDDGLQYFQASTGINWLCLHHTNITDSGLQHLQRMKEMELLDLSDTLLAGPGLVHLKEMALLEYLDLSDTKVADEYLHHLQILTKLRHLRLARTNITNTEINHLSTLTHLEYLDLAGTGISDKGLDVLARLVGLKILVLDDTQVTPEGVSRLQKALPSCSIRFDGGRLGAEVSRLAP